MILRLGTRLMDFSEDPTPFLRCLKRDVIVNSEARVYMLMLC